MTDPNRTTPHVPGPHDDGATLGPSSTSPPGADTPPDVAPVWPDLAPGYDILDELGRGGMGIVFRAVQVATGRVVALKMILTGTPAGTAERERFRSETEAVARLQHPNVVQLFDAGEYAGRAYVAFEYCPGGSLDRRLQGTPTRAKYAAELVGQLARGVAAAHAKGIIHRDLKPSNVFLAEDGTPKVADFGLAKELGDDGGATRTGAVMGSPSYMSPEQASGNAKRVGRECDVYALGAILYECLTGRPPFKGATTLETLDAVRSQEPVPPRQLNGAVPRDLETICLKCLRKVPERRYRTADALADDLGRFLAGRPVKARRVGRLERAWRWCRRSPGKAATLVIAVAGIVAVGLMLRGREQQRNREEWLLELQLRELAAFDHGQVAGTIKEDFAALRGVAVFLRMTDRPDPKQLAQFASQIFRGHRNELPGVLWIPRVAAADRAAFEREWEPGDWKDKKQGPFRIREWRADGTLAAAGDRPEYFPIASLGRKSIFGRGVDASTHPVLGPLLTQAASPFGPPRATRWLRMPPAVIAEEGLGEWLGDRNPPFEIREEMHGPKATDVVCVYLVAQYNHRHWVPELKQHQDVLLGYLALVFNVDELCRDLERLRSKGGLPANISLTDIGSNTYIGDEGNRTTEVREARQLADREHYDRLWADRAPPSVGPPGVARATFGRPLESTSSIQVGDRQWQIRVLPTAEWLSRRQP